MGRVGLYLTVLPVAKGATTVNPPTTMSGASSPGANFPRAPNPESDRGLPETVDGGNREAGFTTVVVEQLQKEAELVGGSQP